MVKKNLTFLILATANIINLTEDYLLILDKLEEEYINKGVFDQEIANDFVNFCEIIANALNQYSERPVFEALPITKENFATSATNNQKLLDFFIDLHQKTIKIKF